MVSLHVAMQRSQRCRRDCMAPGSPETAAMAAAKESRHELRHRESARRDPLARPEGREDGADGIAYPPDVPPVGEAAHEFAQEQDGHAVQPSGR